MFEYLKTLKFSTFPTVNKFINKVDDFLKVKQFNKDLSQVPKRTDFIPYDNLGNVILGHKPIFKGWTVCKETSNETIKVAKLITKDNEYRIYFDTKDGVIIVSTTNMSDNVTYNDLAIFFEGNLKLN